MCLGICQSTFCNCKSSSPRFLRLRRLACTSSIRYLLYYNFPSLNVFRSPMFFWVKSNTLCNSPVASEYLIISISKLVGMISNYKDCPLFEFYLSLPKILFRLAGFVGLIVLLGQFSKRSVYFKGLKAVPCFSTMLANLAEATTFGVEKFSPLRETDLPLFSG